uniref:Uncharacterized protein n=1 Tax=Spongospora subterranea TaxID=70186 RepID=A0A0H5RC88_9EUKA|eukprot:CRZ11840.1 hypothetical protein [Spongospora subterranea]
MTRAATSDRGLQVGTQTQSPDARPYDTIGQHRYRQYEELEFHGGFVVLRDGDRAGGGVPNGGGRQYLLPLQLQIRQGLEIPQRSSCAASIGRRHRDLTFWRHPGPRVRNLTDRQIQFLERRDLHVELPDRHHVPGDQSIRLATARRQRLWVQHVREGRRERVRIRSRPDDLGAARAIRSVVHAEIVVVVFETHDVVVRFAPGVLRFDVRGARERA